MRVLVTGANGYVGSRLVPALLAEGHDVRAAFTDRTAAAAYWWASQVEVAQMDVLDPEGVVLAVEGVDAVVYLIHGLAGDDFAAKDRQSAHNMADACRLGGVERLVYLGGLVPNVHRSELSDHISSRLDVERVLSNSGVRTIVLRAAVIIGAGSTSFEVIRQISERLLLQAIPSWMDSQVQPVAVVDVTQALLGALTVDSGSRSYDIGGPDRLSYPELLSRFADAAGIIRPQVPLAGLPPGLVATLSGWLTDVPGSTVQSLVGSLQHDMVCHETDFAAELLRPGHQLVDVEESLRRALVQPDPGTPVSERDPQGPLPTDPDWAGGLGGGVTSLVAGVAGLLGGAVAASTKLIRIG